ncbi:hypothetical protein [Thermostaphylospora chromogena]|uniref:Lipoprotein n=1 Tax=Thermostaphylospora chromogena TaxID=35622 RepID=A0A1H1FGG0_9ACTN|nr:hypothetical protein [Thermostaphylospora chromogena]SDQ99957.1 hypothetical protein SAMN04489764_2972 [Thermostaphylospora chromogena]
MHPPRLDRRALLRGAAALGAGAAAAGCAGSGTSPASVTPPSPHPQTLLLRRLIADKEETIALYRRAAADDERLRAFQRRHEIHLAELKRHLPPAETATPSPASAAASPATVASSSPTPEKVTTERLRKRERESAASRLDQIESVSPSLAQLLAGIGACEAVHALALARSR